MQILKQKTEWETYYDETNYGSESENHKKLTIISFLTKAAPKTVWDLGSNNGTYSRLASDQGINTISFDIDEIAVNNNYKKVRDSNENYILPLLLDITNPSPDIGWANDERQSLENRGPCDLVMALALIHHLTISNNIPLIEILEYFSKLAKWLIIEFIPKSDSQVQRLFSTRKDIFPNYTIENFELAINEYFIVIDSIRLVKSERMMYLLKAK